MKKSLLACVIVLLGGCTQHSALELFHKDKLFEKALLYTKKIDMVSSFETKAIVNATYLNPIDTAYKTADAQNFIVGLFIADQGNIQEKDPLQNPNFQLTLDGKKPLQAKELETTHMMYPHIPLKNHWAKYYFVSFAKDDAKKHLLLEYKHTTFGTITLQFEAE